jgi:DNA polymerase V
VQGKSMQEVGIYDGDLLIVDKSISPKNFSTVIANVNEELVVKSLIKEKGLSYLTSGSKNILEKINLEENPEVIIWGVVTYVIHKLQ